MNPYLTTGRYDCDPVYFETTGDDKLTPRQLTDLIDQVVSEMEMAKLQIERDTLDGATRHVERSLMLIKEIDIELWQSSRISGVPYAAKQTEDWK
jgi:hypothetical protein